ncbi:hypothetical protein jhhlp_001417 [Lomentospora prolificans]|uniref:GPI2-domain-containing protein n=1 Tax=Lomentospora prolificans TaxID=41688 RepID=A0A2N3NI38_9PEZI|nr:hypothetical protein jhhlp_001417 [Lomentospora prolificans]
MATPLSARTQLDFDRSFPGTVSSPVLTRSSTVPTNLGGQRTDRSRLAPEDAFYAISPPRRIPPVAAAAVGRDSSSPVLRHRRRNGGANGTGTGHRTRKRRRSWKKLLWVDRAYPDNYTDQATFLEQLQRNPCLQPYDFWPLVADTTIIVQHVCSVIIFIVAFVAIIQERVTHVSLVSYSSGLTFLGWLVWERWVADAEDREEEQIAAGNPPPTTTLARGGSRRRTGSIRRRATLLQEARAIPTGLGITTTKENLNAVSDRLQESSSMNHHPHHPLRISANGNGAPPTVTSSSSATHLSSYSSSTTRPSSIPTQRNYTTTTLNTKTNGSATTNGTTTTTTTWHPASPRNRTSTIPGSPIPTPASPTAGASYHQVGPHLLHPPRPVPILKSLTRSTSSDSIWAMCFFLLTINILFFDYSGDVSGANFPASLSTNAALMASTMLASRLPSTGQVFSLTVLSIEVFGLFPVFRRYARHRPWRYHVLQTALLVLVAGAGVGFVLGDPASPAPRAARNCLLGMLMGAVVAALAMGGCSWWLIGLQKYKNEINGPWDAARPVIISRRRY